MGKVKEHFAFMSFFIISLSAMGIEKSKYQYSKKRRIFSIYILNIIKLLVEGTK